MVVSVVKTELIVFVLLNNSLTKLNNFNHQQNLLWAQKKVAGETVTLLQVLKTWLPLLSLPQKARRRVQEVTTSLESLMVVGEGGWSSPTERLELEGPFRTELVDQRRTKNHHRIAEQMCQSGVFQYNQKVCHL